MHGACMATKTISIDLEAYRRLDAARTHAKESFSQVIRRARWKREGVTGRRLLSMLNAGTAAPREVLDHLEENQKLDAPPDDPWR